MEPIAIQTGSRSLAGLLGIPKDPKGIVIFAHGSGSSHQSPRNIHVAKVLENSAFITLLFDLLDPKESTDRSLVFDIPLLSERLKVATEWLLNNEDFSELKVGYFGASTGSAAALTAAASGDYPISAIVSRGGRPDLALNALPRVTAPTLLIVGENDTEVIEMNRRAAQYLEAAQISIIPGASHLFEEPGKLDQVAIQARNWFLEKLAKSSLRRIS